jgi:hypothetical protein
MNLHLFAANLIAMSKDLEFHKLKKYVMFIDLNKTIFRWDEEPTVVNAFYASTTNSISKLIDVIA